MSATTAQQAALRILLEDVEPLIQRAEATGATVQTAHEGLRVDLATLATLVQRSVEAPAALLEAARRLDSAAARIEAAAAALPAAQADGRKAAGGAARRGHLAGAALALFLAGAACGAGAVVTVARAERDDARLGRALQQAWTALDATTRAKVEAALKR